MRIGRWLAIAAVVALGACSSGSKDNATSTPTTNPFTTGTTSTGGPSTTADGSTPTTADASAPTSAETPPTSLPSDPAAAVKAFAQLAQQELTDAEAACVAQSTGPGIVASLNTTLQTGSIDAATSKLLVKAFAVCEPASYFTDTTSSIAQQSGATQAQAECVLKAVDQLFVSDDAVLTQASSDTATKDWPAAEHSKFLAAVTTCVPADLAAKIVDS